MAIALDPETQPLASMLLDVITKSAPSINETGTEADSRLLALHGFVMQAIAALEGQFNLAQPMPFYDADASQADDKSDIIQMPAAEFTPESYGAVIARIMKLEARLDAAGL